ncbi:MAG: hypothetical protein GVY23_10045 [Spirochaetes bacterium]|jgi:hypothetical protein|nr:hypothetical protein [Spirochaetota bacterium]
MQRAKRLYAAEKPLFIAVAMLLATFVISLVFYLTLHAKNSERVLFFPGNITDDISGERRVVTNFSELERDMEALAEEVILGPTSLYRSRVLPKDTAIRLFMLRENVLYVDLSREALFGDESLRLDFVQSVSVLRRSLEFNFRSLEEVVITVEGQLPNEPYFEQQYRQNEA